MRLYRCRFLELLFDNNLFDTVIKFQMTKTHNRFRDIIPCNLNLKLFAILFNLWFCHFLDLRMFIIKILLKVLQLYCWEIEWFQRLNDFFIFVLVEINLVLLFIILADLSLILFELYLINFFSIMRNRLSLL